MNVKEQVSEGQSSLPSVDYLVGCSYSLGASCVFF